MRTHSVEGGEPLSKFICEPIPALDDGSVTKFERNLERCRQWVEQLQAELDGHAAETG